MEEEIILSTAAGDGGLRVSVDAFGAFGSSASGDAFYDPVGGIDEAGTVFESAVAVRVGNTGGRTFLSAFGIGASGNLENPGFSSSGETEANSSFAFGGLNFDLRQTVSDSIGEDGDRNGSSLVQTYTITNPTGAPISFELVRYLDGDLLFDGSLTDGGGLITNGNTELLFETDTAAGTSEATTFLGFTSEGGSTREPGRFEIDAFPDLLERITAGEELDGLITGDSDDEDSFVDTGAGFDITLALRNAFALSPGESTTYTTATIFGSGAPDEVPVIDHGISVGVPTLIEGDSGSQTLTFTIARSGTTQFASSVDFAIGGTATNAVDYNGIGGSSGATELTGTIAFAPDETEQTISLAVLGDLSVEADETIEIELSNPTVTGGTATIRTDSAIATIANDDADDGNNMPPELAEIATTGVEDAEVALPAGIFAAAFSDDDEDDTLQSINVTSLPATGVLSLGENPVTANLTIAVADLDTLRYVPAADESGEVTFQVAASDGAAFSEPATLAIELDAINDAPSFALGATELTFTAGTEVSEPALATEIFAGPADEAEQALTFAVTTAGDDIFTVAPTLDPATGNLNFALAETIGTATLEVVLTDDGGTGNGGADTSAAQTLTIASVIPAVNVLFATDNEAAQIDSSGLVFEIVGADFGSTLADDLLELGTDAAFDNLLGLYEVVDAAGGIDTDGDGIADILPGDPDYARAAIENRKPEVVIRGGSSGDPSRNTTAENFAARGVVLESDRTYAPFLIANAGGLSFQGYLTRESNEGDGDFNDAADSITDPVAYFAFGAANPDGAAHVRALGNDTFGFEDLPANLGVSDNDFNDIVVRFAFA